MDQIGLEPPPLPAKNRRSPPGGVSQTVLSSAVRGDEEPPAGDMYQYNRFPEVTSAHTQSHVVKIRINPKETVRYDPDGFICESVSPCIRISVNAEPELIQNTSTMTEATSNGNAYFYYGPFNCSVMSSGQISPSDTLDSGTCSDIDGTPPPLPKKKNGVSVTLIGVQHKRASSLTSSGAEVDSDDNDSNLSCDSLNSGKISPSIEKALPQHLHRDTVDSGEVSPRSLHCVSIENEMSPRIDRGLKCLSLNAEKASPVTDKVFNSLETLEPLNDEKLSQISENSNHPPAVIRAQHKKSTTSTSSAFLPQLLLQDIRQRSVKLASPELIAKTQTMFDEKSYEERKVEEERKQEEKKLDKINYDLQYETDKFYDFHLNEHLEENNEETTTKCIVEDESFAGVKNLLGEDMGTIRSAKGTVRGVKNRVRAGIATFLQINDNIRNYREKDSGKVVVYSTTMGIIRETFQACMKVKKIMRTLLVKFEERDVFMSTEYQTEIKERMHCDYILIPQVFVDGQHIGDAETIERLNESGELRKILKPYKTMDACTTCKACGGFRLLPCQVCNGSKKSVHRNHFTTEFVALKCMNCDEVGLVRCSFC